MKKLFNIKFKTYEIIVTIFSCFTMLLITYLSYLIAIKHTVTLIQYEFILSVIGVFNLSLILLSVLNKHFKLKPADIFILCLSIFAIISYLFSYNRETSLIGVSGRNEGLIMILTYYSLFLLNSSIKDIKYKKIIIAFFIFGSIFNLQDKFFQYNTGFIGHHNFFATLCLLASTLSFNMFIFTKDKIKYVYLIIGFIFLPYLISCVTSSVNVALIINFIMIIIFLIIISIMNKKFKKDRLKNVMLLWGKFALIISIIFISIKVSSKSFDVNDIKRELNSIKYDIGELLKGNLYDDWGSQRGFIWKEAMKRVPNHLIHGIGIDCIIYINNGTYLLTPYTNRIVDKVHNEYLQILACEGIFSFITYIGFIIYVIVYSIKYIFKKELLNNTIYIPLLLTFISYVIQAIANIRVTRVAPFFFILFGLLYQRYVGNKDES